MLQLCLIHLDLATSRRIEWVKTWCLDFLNIWQIKCLGPWINFISQHSLPFKKAGNWGILPSKVASLGTGVILFGGFTVGVVVAKVVVVVVVLVVVVVVVVAFTAELVFDSLLSSLSLLLCFTVRLVSVVIPIWSQWCWNWNIMWCQSYNQTSVLSQVWVTSSPFRCTLWDYYTRCNQICSWVKTTFGKKWILRGCKPVSKTNRTLLHHATHEFFRECNLVKLAPWLWLNHLDSNYDCQISYLCQKYLHWYLGFWKLYFAPERCTAHFLHLS